MMKDVGKFLEELKSFDATNIDPRPSSTSCSPS